MVSAVIIFFLMTFIGLLHGMRQEIICLRALKGAAIAYVTVMLAMRIFFGILINQIAANELEKENRDKAE